MSFRQPRRNRTARRGIRGDHFVRSGLRRFGNRVGRLRRHRRNNHFRLLAAGALGEDFASAAAASALVIGPGFAPPRAAARMLAVSFSTGAAGFAAALGQPVSQQVFPPAALAEGFAVVGLAAGADPAPARAAARMSFTLGRSPGASGLAGFAAGFSAEGFAVGFSAAGCDASAAAADSATGSAADGASSSGFLAAPRRLPCCPLSCRRKNFGDRHFFVFRHYRNSYSAGDSTWPRRHAKPAARGGLHPNFKRPTQRAAATNAGWRTVGL